MNHRATANKWPLSRGNANVSQHKIQQQHQQHSTQANNNQQQQEQQPIPAATNTFSRKFE